MRCTLPLVDRASAAPMGDDISAIIAKGRATIRDWGSFDDDYKRKAVSGYLGFMIGHAKIPMDDVLTHAVCVLAQLVKRGWDDFQVAEMGKVFDEVEEAVTNNQDLAVQIVGISFLKSLVCEFSPTTSSALGLPREFHERCRISLEQVYLREFYSWLICAASNVSDRITKTDNDIPATEVCSAALCLMDEILNWDFGNKDADVKSKRGIDVFCHGKQESNSLRRSCILVQPGLHWRDVLISKNHVQWLLKLYAGLRKKVSFKDNSTDCSLAIFARKLIVKYCSLTGAIFKSDSGEIEKHLLELLPRILKWIERPNDIYEAIRDGNRQRYLEHQGISKLIQPTDDIPEAVKFGNRASELLDGCRALKCIATVTSPVIFDDLLRSLSRPYGTLSLLSTLMSEVLRDFMEHHRVEGTCSWVARDILLDTWTSLLLQMDDRGHNHLLPDEGITAVNNFALIVQSELMANDKGKYDNFQAYVSAMDKRLSSYALIARAAVGCAIPMLREVFLECTADDKIKGKSITSGELESLLLISGHVLADEGQGEPPLVPKELKSHSNDIVKLSSSIIGFAEKSLHEGKSEPFLAARLMEAVVWFLTRWSSTYLMPSGEIGNEDLLREFGDNNEGKRVLDSIIKISLSTLLFYPGEKDLQALTCCQLLRGLVKRKSIISHLVTLDSWNQLFDAFVKERAILSLNAAHQRSLAQTLTVSASGLTPDQSNGCIQKLTDHITVKLRALPIVETQHPDTILLVSFLLERLRGVARASEPCLQYAIGRLGFSLVELVSKFLQTYDLQHVVVYPLLKFFKNWVKGGIIYLTAQETWTVVQLCMNLLHAAAAGIVQMSASVSNNLHTEAKLKFLQVLLQLFSNLCSKDLVDFTPEVYQVYGPNNSQVGTMCLQILRLITPKLLRYPKLCRCYFTLLSHMLEVYPGFVEKLSIDVLSHIIGNLEFGLQHKDVEGFDFCLRALKALASYQYEDFNGKFRIGLSRFLYTLLQQLFVEDYIYSIDAVDSTADALLPLILCETSAYQNAVDILVGRQIYPESKERLREALWFPLLTSNIFSSTLESTHYQIFRKNLHSVLIEIRAFCRTL